MVQLVAGFEQFRPRDAEAFIPMVVRVSMTRQASLENLSLRPDDIRKSGNCHLVTHQN